MNLNFIPVGFAKEMQFILHSRRYLAVLVCLTGGMKVHTIILNIGEFLKNDKSKVSLSFKSRGQNYVLIQPIF